MKDLPRNDFSPREDGRDNRGAIEEVANLFREGLRGITVESDGKKARLPAPLARLLKEAASHMAGNGGGVTLVQRGSYLDAREISELLHVSKDYAERLLDDGKIPYRTLDKIGSPGMKPYRQADLEDVIAYKAAENARRKEALDELTATGQESPGGYF